MSYLRLLFWLKWKLLWRGYARERSARVGAILTLVFFLPLSLAMVVLTAAFLKLTGIA